MKNYAMVVALTAAIGLAGLVLTQGQLQTRGQTAPSDVSADVNEKIKQLSSSDPTARAAAACALGKIGAQATPAIPALIRLLADGGRVTPEQVCYREYFTAPNLEPEFAGLKEPSVGEAAVQALIRLGSASVEPLIAALKDQEWRARKNAAWALAQIRDGRQVDALIASTTDQVWQVRAYSAAALGQQNDSRVVEPLISALRDQHPAVRWFAASSLGQTRDRRAVEPLIAALKDQHPRTRAYAAASLGQLKDSRAVMPLIEALNDTEAQVRMYAAAALGQQGDGRARDGLTAALNDQHAQVREYAKRALDQLRN